MLLVVSRTHPAGRGPNTVVPRGSSHCIMAFTATSGPLLKTDTETSWLSLWPATATLSSRSAEDCARAAGKRSSAANVQTSVVDWRSFILRKELFITRFTHGVRTSVHSATLVLLPKRAVKLWTPPTRNHR